MDAVTITVSGNAMLPHPAERALLEVFVSTEGSTEQSVTEKVTSTAGQVQEALRALSPTDETEEAKAAAAISHWSMKSLRTSSFVPYDSDGRQQTRRYTARADFEIRFRDFNVLGPFSTQLAAMPHVQMNGVQWILTDATKHALQSELRKMAARDALVRARDYAEALGLGNVRLLELSEGAVSSLVSGAQTGLFRSQQPPQMQLAAGFGAPSNDRSELSFQAEEVQATAQVSAKFSAS
ncbi:hypothetical protein LTR66_003405 [Elasticomyces elasticus]|nr:hypothetical protein LTR28_008301 [Elasticomyces elasticus]KAK4997117.1 hypothetical protein LTR66_003405 [Elasticomyces elasticus]